ncbi:MAG: hypothetical protein Q7J67_01690 [bacterium]|nr:hypothetical protein [bacterium]
MNTKKGFLRLTIIFSIIVYAITFGVCFMDFNNYRPDYRMKSKYKATDKETGKTVAFDWEGVNPPTESDLEEIFAKARNISSPKTFNLDVKPKILTDDDIRRFDAKEKYDNAKLSLLLTPLAFFAGVWSLWIIYFIIRVLSVWVIRGFKK